MTKLQPALWFATMLLLGIGWLHFFHDPSVRATEKLRDQTHATDSSSHQTDTRIARLAADSFQREAELARLDAKLRGARGEIARLREGIIPDSGKWKTAPVDSIPALAIQLAIRDTLIAQQASEIAADSVELTTWKALAQERGQLLQQAISERNSYRRIIAQQKPSRFGCVGGVSMAVGWGRGAGVGVTCGIRI